MDMDLGKQVGPLPLGAWVVVVASGVGIVIWTRSRQNATPPTAPPVDTSGGVGTGGSGIWDQLSQPTTPAQTTPTIDTNEAWAVAAINYLIAQGYDPAVSDSAIRKYLAVEQQSTQEYALTRVVLQHLGSPPIPLPPGPGPVTVTPPPPTSAPPPVQTPPPPPPSPAPAPTRRTFTVTRWPLPGSSLWSIAGIVYGNSSRWPEIYNANRGLIGSNPNLIHPGQVLTIP